LALNILSKAATITPPGKTAIAVNPIVFKTSFN